MHGLPAGKQTLQGETVPGSHPQPPSRRRRPLAARRHPREPYRRHL